MDEKKNTAELVADLCLDPGFVLVPQDRYEELIRAETERDVMEAVILGAQSYQAEDVMRAILTARRKAIATRKPEAESEDNAQ